MGFFWDFGGKGQDIWWEPPRNAMTADLRRLVKKNYRHAPNTLVCTLGKEITKKRNVYAVRVTFHPCAALTPLNP